MTVMTACPRHAAPTAASCCAWVRTGPTRVTVLPLALGVIRRHHVAVEGLPDAPAYVGGSTSTASSMMSAASTGRGPCHLAHESLLDRRLADHDQSLPTACRFTRVIRVEAAGRSWQIRYIATAEGTMAPPTGGYPGHHPRSAGPRPGHTVFRLYGAANPAPWGEGPECYCRRTASGAGPWRPPATKAAVRVQARH